MVDRRAHRVQAVFYSFLLLSMHTPSTSFRAAVGEFRVQVDASAVSHASANYSPALFDQAFESKDAVNETPTMGVYSRHGNESGVYSRHGNESGLNSSRIMTGDPFLCDMLSRIAGYFGSHATTLGRITNAYSAGVITHQLIAVEHWDPGFIDVIAQTTSHTIGSFNLWLGTIWTAVQLAADICEGTLGSCASIVNVVFLFVSLVFIAIFLFPAFCTAVAAHVVTAGAVVWLGTHLGQLVVATILLVWRNIMQNICQIIDNGFLHISVILEVLREEVNNMVATFREITGQPFSRNPFEAVIRRWRRQEGALSAHINRGHGVSYQEAHRVNEIFQLHASAKEAMNKSLRFSMSGCTLTRENLNEYVDPAELIVRPGNETQYPAAYDYSKLYPGFHRILRRKSRSRYDNVRSKSPPGNRWGLGL